MSRRQLIGHVSPETAYVVQDYPYGFRLRCQIRYWIETKPGFGQRLVSQTSNPKRVADLVWNKPKSGIYHPIVVLYLNDMNGHVESDALSPYDDRQALESFVVDWEMDKYQELVVRARRIAHRVANGMSRDEAIAKAGVLV